MPSVFISYSHHDKDAARAVHDALVARGIDVHWDENFVEDAGLSAAIEEDLERSDALVVLCSKASKNSTYVGLEVKYATIWNMRIIPVVLPGEDADKVKKFLLLEHLHITLNALDDSAAFDRLYRAIIWPESFTQPANKTNAPLPPRPGMPAPYWMMLIVREHLTAALQQIRDASRGAWRGTLLWFYEDVWYIAVKNGRYSDAELRLWLRRGEGFMGRLWEAHDPDIHYTIDYPRKVGTAGLTASYRLTPQSAEITNRMTHIVSFPIFGYTTGRPVMVGALALDAVSGKLQAPNAAVLDSILKLARSIAQLLAGHEPYDILPYQSFRALRTLLRTARLIPDLSVAARAGLYWVNRKEKQAHLIAASERDETPYSTRHVPIAGAHHPVTKAWLRKKVIARRRGDQMFVIALPVFSSAHSSAGRPRVIAVLELRFDDPGYDADSETGRRDLVTLAHLADLCGKVLENRHERLYD